MAERLKPYAGVILVLMLAAAALGYTVHSFFYGQDTARRIARKRGDLRTIRGQAAALGPVRAALAAYEALPAGRLDPLREIIGREAPGVRMEVHERRKTEWPDGWTLTTHEVMLEQIRFERLDAALAAAEKARPPWRLTECTMTAVQGAPGVGRAVLVFEGLERAEGWRRGSDGDEKNR